jgi:hypothetical protein
VFLKSFILISILFFQISCSKGFDVTAPGKAPEKVEQSFQPELRTQKVNSPGLTASDYLIKISKNSLEKEFLLMGSIVPQASIPTFSNLKSRVVMFVKKGGMLQMLESTVGNQITEELPMDLLLASFPIEAETEDEITFDFNAGMSQIFMVSGWYGSDFEGEWYSYKLQPAHTETSFIDSIEFLNNRMVIKQIARISSEGDSTPVKVIYYLTPYLPDPTFVPQKGYDFKKFGFFEVPPQLTKDGKSIVYVSKWNEKNPIVFAISANTPEHIRPAIRDGILYWNKILGDNKIQVVQLTDKNITAPHPEFNIIQWVNWDDAGMAYADAHMDPRSGQILHAQVFMTSVFEVGGRSSLIRRLRYLENKADDQKLNTKVLLKGFESSVLCRREFDQNLIQSLKSLVASSASDELIKKASMDYVREVVAHEVGHTLGLRHNFAGSLSASFYASEVPGLFKQYVENMKAPEGVVTSSSVMEYQPFEESVMAGDQISRTDHPADSYDRAAIETLYLNKNHSKSPTPLFCTDSEAERYFDCNRFDSGKSAVESTLKKDLPKQAAQLIINNYINNLISDEPVPTTEVNLWAKSIASSLMNPQFKLVSIFDKNARFVSFRKQASESLVNNSEELKEKENSYILSEVSRLGGIKKILSLVPSDFTEATYQNVKTYLSFPDVKKGSEFGKDFEISEEDQKIILAQTRKVLPLIEKELRMLELLSLSGQRLPSPYYPEKKPERMVLFSHPLAFDLAAFLAQVQQQYLFEKTESFYEDHVIHNNGDSFSVKLPVYKHDYELRLASLSLLDPKYSDSIEWGYVEKASTKKSMDQELSLLGPKSDEIAKDKLSKDVLRWILQNNEIKKRL